MAKKASAHALAATAGSAPPGTRRSTRQRLQASSESAGLDEGATRPKKRAGSVGSGDSVAGTDPEELSVEEEENAPRKRQRQGLGSTAAQSSAAPAKPVKGPPPPSRPDDDDAQGASNERRYWLMKAEPESRFQNGVDVKFSIDDLAARTAPEPWDGIRNYAARNNLRAMRKGDLAFFYHSNCILPALVGTMEIVKEHEPDLSAHDPEAPYYDPKNRSWSLVWVQFRTKFRSPITLKELREMGRPVELLKKSRLSVSAVHGSEWDYIMGVVAERGG